MPDDLRERLQAALGSAYLLKEELGGGGMSRVFVAHEVALGRMVVVKVLLPELARGVSIDRFRREIQLAAKLQHPHIVPLLSAGEADGLPFFTMPFVAGDTLRARLARGGELPISVAVRLLRDLASALAYAHGQGVVHRDIKPENILLPSGVAMVTDFGVAKAVTLSAEAVAAGHGPPATLTSLGIALGTPAYMAPEQASADPKMDHRVDIYAFGVVAYEALTGQPPFTGRPPQALLAAHAIEPPDPVGQRRAGIPETLAALVMRCLEKHPADRPQTAAEIVTTLDSLATPSVGLTPTVQDPVRRRRTERLHGAWEIVRLALGLAGLATAGLVLYFHQWSPVQWSSVRTGEVPAATEPSSRDSVAAGGADAGPGLPAAPGPRHDRSAATDSPTASPGTSPSTAPGASPGASRAASRRPSSAAPAVAPGPPTAAPTRHPEVRPRTAKRLRPSDGDPSVAPDSAPAAGAAASSAAGPEPQRAASATGQGDTAPNSVTPAAPPTPPDSAAAAPPAVGRRADGGAPPDPRRQIDSVVGAYAAAIEARSIPAIQRVYPGLTDEARRDWEEFFTTAHDIDARLAVTDLQTGGGTATAAVAGEYRFVNATTRHAETHAVAFRATLRRDGTGWRIVDVR